METPTELMMYFVWTFWGRRWFLVLAAPLNWYWFCRIPNGLIRSDRSLSGKRHLPQRKNKLVFENVTKQWYAWNGSVSGRVLRLWKTHNMNLNAKKSKWESSQRHQWARTWCASIDERKVATEQLNAANTTTPTLNYMLHWLVLVVFVVLIHWMLLMW